MSHPTYSSRPHAGARSGMGWAAPRAVRPLAATVALPGSKSLTNRELVLSALATGPSTLTGALRSRDTDLMIAALRTLGARIEVEDDAVQVEPLPAAAPAAGTDEPAAGIDCGLAGTVMRFVPPVAALTGRRVRFDGDAAARRRPMAPLLDALRRLGVPVDAPDGRLPFEIGPGAIPRGGTVWIDASGSSQFLSALLLVGARLPDGLDLEDRGGRVPSVPHIQMTIACLRQRGVPVEAGERHWRIPPRPVAGRDVVIEPDLSNAAPFLAAAAVAGGRTEVRNWPERTTQVGDRFPDLLRRMGVRAERVGGRMRADGTGAIHGLDADMGDAGELVPTLAAVAALADSPSRIRGVAHLRGHETNRLAAIVDDLTSLGGDAEETEDGLAIRPAPLHGGIWEARGDHRMATAGALIGLRVEGVEVDDIGTTAKTMPDFPRLWAETLGLGEAQGRPDQGKTPEP